MYHSNESGKRAFYCQPHFDRLKWFEAQIWATSIRGMVIETKAPAKGSFFVPFATFLESLNYYQLFRFLEMPITTTDRQQSLYVVKT